MAKKRVRKFKVTKGEVLVYSVGVLCLGLTILLKIFCGANIGNLNMSVEKLKGDISIEEKKLESLTMKVNELTSFDNVKDIVKDMGLAYNNDNIIVISE